MLQHCLLTEMAVFSEMDVFSMSPVCSVQTNETNFLEGDELRKCIYSRTSTISLNEKISISEHDVGVLIRHHCSYRPLKKAALLTIANVLNANMPTSPWRRKTTPRGQILKGKDKRPSGVMSAPIQIDGEKYLCNITVKQNLDGIIFPYALTLKDKSGNIVGDEKTDCTLQVPDSDDKCSTTGNTHLDKVATSPDTSQSSQNRANLQQNTLTSNNNNKENINCNKNMKHNRIRLTESQLHRVIKESVKRIIDEDEDVVQQAVDAIMGIRDVVDRAVDSFAWSEKKKTPLQQALQRLNKEIYAVYGFSNYGDAVRKMREQEKYEQD